MADCGLLPTWLAAGAPFLALVGVLIGSRIARKSDVELETRSRREETMRTLKWAAELAVSGDEARADLGLRELHALQGSALLDPEQRTFIAAALASVYASTATKIETAVDGREQVDVVIPQQDVTLPDLADAHTPAVSSDEDDL
jgi:hypothetical protein